MHPPEEYWSSWMWGNEYALKFYSNHVSNYRGGAGVYFYNSNATLSSTVVKNNTLYFYENTSSYSSTHYCGGAGVYFYNSDIQLESVTIDSNYFDFWWNYT